MAFSSTYDIATPVGGADPQEADDKMREIKAATQERENVDHYWPLTGTEVSDADAGEHRKVTLRVGSAPPAVADKGFVYAKDVGGKAELFYRDEDGNEVQITTGGILNSLNLTGVQTVAGVKTFSASPIVPAPTTNLQASTKKYVDDQQDPSYSGGESHTFNGGLIIKMGVKTFNGGSDSVSFGTAFPTNVISITLTLTDVSGGGAHVVNLTTTSNLSGFSFISASASSITNLHWMAIGY